MSKISNIKYHFLTYVYRSKFPLSNLKISREKLNTMQLKRLKNTLSYAGAKVPYYRELFQRIGFDPRKMNSLDEMKQIPFLDKEILRNNPDQFLSEDISKLDVEYVHTSGSTGTPLCIAQDIYSRSSKAAATLRAMEMAGYRLGCKWFSLWGVYATTKPTPFGIDKLLNKVYYSNNLMTETNNIEVGKLLLRFKPSFYSGYAQSFYELGRTLHDRQIPIYSPRGIFVYGDWLPDTLRVEIEDLYQAPVYDFYSHSENSVMINENSPGVKFIAEDYFYPEIILDESKDNIGELVGTSFYNYAMPLIRYRTRDLIELDSKFDDYTGFRRVKRILGRIDDYLLMSDGRKVLSGQRAIYGIPGIKSCQYIQDRFNHMTINIISDGNFSNNDEEVIRSRIREVTKTDMDVDFQLVDQLTQNKFGKVQFIIRKIPGVNK